MDSVIQIKAVAKAKQSEICGRFADGIKIRIAAQPEKGAANQELVRFIADKLGLPASQIEIISGFASPIKRIRIRGETKNQIFRRLGLEE
jgi:uncharacterized protein